MFNVAYKMKNHVQSLNIKIMKKITFSIAYKKLRELISKVTGRPENTIVGDMNMSKFGFKPDKLIQFTNELMQVYEDYELSINDEQVGKCKMVNDLMVLIWTSIPSKYKEGASHSMLLAVTIDNPDFTNVDNDNQNFIFNMLINEIDTTKRIELEAEKESKEEKFFNMRDINISINIY